MTKTNKLSGPAQVTAFFDQLDHPLKPAMQMIREIVLGLDDSITEHIKWNAPSFCHGGDDRVTFNMHKSGDVLLIFHRGAKSKAAKGSGHLIEDATGLLEWPADDRAVLKLSSVHDIMSKRDLLEHIVRQWIDAAGD